MQGEYDVVVVGAGVIGAATARELARYDLRVLVVEAGLDLACGATRANSGVVHAGYDPVPGTLKARYNVAGSALYDQWQRELCFGFYRNGALVLAFDEDDLAMLNELLHRAVANGVEGVSMVGADELKDMEPNVSPNAIAALSVPSSGICDPYGLTYAAAENAAANGVEFAFDTRVVDISRNGDAFAIRTGDGKAIVARTVVNCAGVHADEINNLVSVHKIHIEPVKGEYLLFHSALAGTFRHTVFQAPSTAGKGVLVSPVLFGNIFVGPNSSAAADKCDLATSEEGQREVLARAQRTWPEVSTERVIATYAGLRAKNASGTDDFVVGEAPDAPGFFNAACIDSPGLASAPAIATDLARMVGERLGAGANPSFDPVRIPAPLLVMMDEKSQAELIAQNPRYGVPVCKCCHVSEGEIVDTLHRALPVLTLDALKWRTGATMGPCHGGRCTARILEIARRELGAAAPNAQKRLRESDLVVGDGEQPVDSNALETLAGQCATLAQVARADLDAQGLHEVGSGALGICGTRPAGVYSALQTLGLFGVTGRLPGKRGIVWGTHDLALRTALVLDDAGTVVERVIETDDVPTGSPELLDELAKRGIAVQCGSRVTEVMGQSRLEAATIEHGEVCETLACDLLVASPSIVADRD